MAWEGEQVAVLLGLPRILHPTQLASHSLLTCFTVVLLRHPDEKKSADPREVDDAPPNSRAGRVALQVSLEKLAAECEGKDETEVMRKYIQLCPFVSPESPVAKAALKGVEDGSRFRDASIDRSRGSKGSDRVVASDTQSRIVPPSRIRRFAGITVRALFFDLPLLLIFVVHASLEWIDFVHANYLYHQLNAMVFTETRRQEEITYYTRRCDVKDLSTNNGGDLFLPHDTTPQEAYEHHLRHGFTVFRSVLNPVTTKALRDHIVSRNRNLTDDESIYVIENDNRYSFGLGTEEPAVTKAMMEIANHPVLRPSLEKIMGPDPALIEMTAITASYGAIAQYYHDDVIPTASAIRYGRAFGPSYSVFIVLQNTTMEMGATGACPGTHYCSDSGVEELCNKEGFQLVDPKEGCWVAGDALLMNMNSYHRGSAHTDPDGEDRVMLILTFSPKPQNRGESRLMSQGITFSLRWDMWGNTLNDLARADTTMVWPWTTLRALGLFKLPSASWGIDYITGSSMRMANQDYGFKPDEFPDFLEAGGLKWVPKFLHGQVTNEEDSWYEYLQDTFFHCLEFWERVRRYAVGVYLAIFFCLGIFKGKGSRLTTSGMAISRLLVFWALASGMLKLLQNHVASSDWAKDVTAERRYTGVFKNQSAFGIGKPGPTTLPTRSDVLIENRYGSEHLALYEDFVNGHPGNRLFSTYVTAIASQFVDYPPFLRNATERFVLSAIQHDGGRFLYQGAEADWHWLDDEGALEHIRRELCTHAHPLRKTLLKSSRRIISGYMYGLHRSTILAQKYAVPYQRDMESKLLKPMLRFEPPVKAARTLSFVPRQVLPSLARPLETYSRPSLPPASKPSEANEGDWIAAGDVVEHYEEGYWYYSNVLSVSAHAKYKVWYPYTKEVGYGWSYTIRRFKPYEQNEEAEHLRDDVYHHCSVRGVNSDGTYDIYLVKFDEMVRSVSSGSLRRFGKDGDGVAPEYKSAYDRKDDNSPASSPAPEDDDYYYYGAKEPDDAYQGDIVDNAADDISLETSEASEGYNSNTGNEDEYES